MTILERPLASPNLDAYYSIRSVPIDGTSGEECDLTLLNPTGRFERIESGVSELELSFPLAYQGCCDCVPEPWRDEIIVERLDPAGMPEGIVWAGPVIQTIEDPFGQPSITVRAADRSVWWSRRPRARTAITGTLDEAVLWRQLVIDAETGGRSGLSIPAATPTGVTVEADIVAASPTAAGTSTETLISRGGLSSVSWTVVANQLIGPGPRPTQDPTVAALDVNAHWVGSGAVVDRDGGGLVSQVRMVYTDPDTNVETVGEFPPTPDVDLTRGLHIGTFDAIEPGTVAQLTELAAQRWRASRDGHTFLVTSSDSLNHTAPVTIWDLVPGRLFSVTSEESCQQIIDELLRLYRVSVRFQGTGDGRALEVGVAVDFGPPGTAAQSAERVSL